MADKAKPKGSTTELQVIYMIGMLGTWKQQLGGGLTRKALAASQFDYLQQQFLQKRNKIQKFMDQLEKNDGNITKQTATYRHQIRQGIKQMKSMVGRLEEQYKKKRKRQEEQISNRKKKIVQNCKLLLQDVQQRQGQVGGVNNYQAKKVMTFTDMKEKLLNEIDENANFIHNQGSQGKLSQVDPNQIDAMDRYKKKDQQIDEMADEVVNGVRQLRIKVKNINQKQGEINQKTKKGAKKMDQLNTRIEKDTQKIKKVIKAFKPTRCCLVAVMALLLIGLAVVIVRMAIS